MLERTTINDLNDMESDEVEKEACARLIEIVFRTTERPPVGMRERYVLSRFERELREREREPGVMVVESATNDVSFAIISRFLVDYELWDASYREVTRSTKKGMKTIYDIYFVFVHRDEAWEPYYDISSMYDTIRELFAEFSSESLWKVSTYDNAFIDRNRTKIRGAFMFSIVCKARQPLYDDGRPVMRWQPLVLYGELGTFGEQYEDIEVKRPLEPTSYLQIDGDSMSLVPAH